MVAFLVVFSLIAAGSLVCLMAEVALKLVARRAERESVATGPTRSGAATAPAGVDPVLTFGFIVTCYGAISLVLVSALPGALALERTLLAYALLCVGGLVGEISITGTTTDLPSLDLDSDEPPQRKPISVGLSLALAVMLNLVFAVLISGQNVIPMVPPAKTNSAARFQEMEPIIVSAERTGRHAERVDFVDLLNR